MVHDLCTAIAGARNECPGLSLIFLSASGPRENLSTVFGSDCRLADGVGFRIFGPDALNGNLLARNNGIFMPPTAEPTAVAAFCQRQAISFCICSTTGHSVRLMPRPANCWLISNSVS